MVGLYESMITNEAQRIMWSKLSDLDLFTQYWDNWSGYVSGGASSGTSQNKIAERGGNEIYDRFDVFSHTGDPFDPTYCIQVLDEIACEELKVSSYERRYAEKIVDRMHELIKLNLDWIKNGNYMDKDGVKRK